VKPHTVLVLAVLTAVIVYIATLELVPQRSGGAVQGGGELTFTPGGEVEVTVCLEREGEPLRNSWTAVEVRDPNETVVWIDQLLTDKRGCVVVKFRLRSDAVEGVYRVYVSAPEARRVVEFRVKRG